MLLSHDQLAQELRKLLYERYGDDSAWYLMDVFDDDCIVQDPQGTLYRMPYTQAEGEGETPPRVTLGSEMSPVVRVQQYLPLTEACSGRLAEALDASGRTWDVVMIEPGVSRNNVLYSPRALREAVPLFEGVRALSRSDEEHRQGKAIEARAIVGWFDHVRYTDGQGMLGRFHVTEDADWLSKKLMSAWRAGKKDLLGFSIVAVAEAHRAMHAGSLVTAVDRFIQAEFVDVVVNPGAGGRLLDVVEADPRTRVWRETQEETRMLQKLIQLLQESRPDLAQTLADDVSEAQVLALLREAATPMVETQPQAQQKSQPAPATADAPTGQGMASATVTVDPTAMSEIREATRIVRRHSATIGLQTQLSESSLPVAVQNKLRTQFTAQIDADQYPSVAQIAEAIEAERTMLTQLAEAGKVQGFGGSAVRVSEDSMDKAVQRLNDFMDYKPGAYSFREAYIGLTGDTRLTGRLADCPNLPALRQFCESSGLITRVHESLTMSAFDAVLGSSMHRRMVEEYARSPFNTWRQIVSVVQLSDLRQQHRTRFGGYGDLPQVAEGDPYTALSSPSDEEATYSPAKYGGTESLTWEMVVNDDAGAIRRIPVRLARAAARTLHKFVFDFLADNPTIYDNVALFHDGSHGNLTSTAFSANEFMGHRRKMQAQTEADSAEVLGLVPRYLIVPSELEETAYDSFKRTTNNDEKFVQTVAPTVIVVHEWTDANNWYSVADPMDIPTIEIGFYGSEEPELWTQDQPTVGTMFTSDQRSYKVRHVYGGAVLDYRGFQGAIVAD